MSDRKARFGKLVGSHDLLYQLQEQEKAFHQQIKKKQNQLDQLEGANEHLSQLESNLAELKSQFVDILQKRFHTKVKLFARAYEERLQYFLTPFLEEESDDSEESAETQSKK